MAAALLAVGAGRKVVAAALLLDIAMWAAAMVLVCLAVTLTYL
jgi:hypothetical protein